MTDRPQKVRVGAALSDVLMTNTGASQGCVLSPVLFTIYTSDCRAHDQARCPSDQVCTSLSGLVADSDVAKYREAVGEMVDCTTSISWSWISECHQDRRDDSRLPQEKGTGPTADHQGWRTSPGFFLQIPWHNNWWSAVLDPQRWRLSEKKLITVSSFCGNSGNSRWAATSCTCSTGQSSNQF